MTGILVFLDTEFSVLPSRDPFDAQAKPKLISIALVTEDQCEFYAEVSGWKARECSQFVRSNVLPHLAGHRLSPDQLKGSLWTFLTSIGLAQNACDYDGDWRHLITALGAQLPPNIDPEYLFVSSINEGFVYEREDDRLPEELPKHHALNDARALGRQWLAWRAAQGTGEAK